MVVGLTGFKRLWKDEIEASSAADDVRKAGRKLSTKARSEASSFFLGRPIFMVIFRLPSSSKRR